MKPILCLDMDCVLADFEKATKEVAPADMYRKDFFLNLDVVPGALEAVRKLWRSDLYDIHILSKPVADSPISYSEKAKWIAQNFPYLLDKITLTQNKALFLGTYLIDDDLKWKPGFPGTFIHFDKNNPVQSWSNIVYYLLDDASQQPDAIDPKTPLFI